MASQSALPLNKSSIFKSTAAKMSRRQLLSLLAASGAASLLSACGTPGSGAPLSLFSTQSPAAFDGYSIFHETMVEMVWPAIKQAADDGAIILLPVGIIEEHGPHIGLASDIYQAYYWTKLTRRALVSKGIPTLIAPPMYWGMSPMVQSYPGTFSVSDTTMRSLIYDIHASLQSWGFKYVFSFNLHGDAYHNHIYQEAVQDAHNKLGLSAYYVYSQGASVLDESLAVYLKEIPVPESIRKHTDPHAGAFETAEMAVFYPQNVNLEVAKTLKPTTNFHPLGYWGDPASYDQIKPEDIKSMGDAIIAATVEAIEAVIKA
jgi:creatinine amidohydrolase